MYEFLGKNKFWNIKRLTGDNNSNVIGLHLEKIPDENQIFSIKRFFDEILNKGFDKIELKQLKPDIEVIDQKCNWVDVRVSFPMLPKDTHSEEKEKIMLLLCSIFVHRVDLWVNFLKKDYNKLEKNYSQISKDYKKVSDKYKLPLAQQEQIYKNSSQFNCILIPNITFLIQAMSIQILYDFLLRLKHNIASRELDDIISALNPDEKIILDYCQFVDANPQENTKRLGFHPDDNKTKPINDKIKPISDALRRASQLRLQLFNLENEMRKTGYMLNIISNIKSSFCLLGMIFNYHCSQINKKSCFQNNCLMIKDNAFSFLLDEILTFFQDRLNQVQEQLRINSGGDGHSDNDNSLKI